MITNRHRISIRSGLRPVVVAAALLAASLAGCSSAAGNGGIATPAPTTTTSSLPPAPGAVTLDLSGVTDAAGLVMVSVIGRNLPSQPVAAVCTVVESDEFSFEGLYMPISGPDPCSVGSEPVEFEPGQYDVIVAVMPGGSTTPAMCTETDVTVDGEATVSVTNLGPSTDCGF